MAGSAISVRISGAGFDLEYALEPSPVGAGLFGTLVNIARFAVSCAPAMPIDAINHRPPRKAMNDLACDFPSRTDADASLRGVLERRSRFDVRHFTGA